MGTTAQGSLASMLASMLASRDAPAALATGRPRLEAAEGGMRCVEGRVAVAPTPEGSIAK